MIDNPFLLEDSAVRSLNRARIVELGGVAAPEGVLGATGYELLSAASLGQQIAAAADRLGLDPAQPELIRRFDACFGHSQARPHALAIARDYGRRLGCLLLMLARGAPANRAARHEWAEAHWAFWRAQRRVVLGGGLLAGQLGAHAVAAAQELLAEAGETGLAAERAGFGAYMPLVGLARAVPPGCRNALVFDFGQTAVKCGLATYQAGQLGQLSLWHDAPSVCDERFAEEARERWERMAALIGEGWQALPGALRPHTAIGIALACYLFGGQPSPRDRGCYGALGRLAPNLAEFVAGELARRLGQAVPVVLLHDGAAAAMAYAGAERAVVITLGTAIGNGFPPAAGAAWPLAPGFALAEQIA